MLAKLAQNTRINTLETLTVSVFSVMKYGLFAMLRKRTFPKAKKVSLAMVMSGHGLLLILIQN
jgi:hypothetical protein